VLVGCGDDLVVTYGAARLDHGGHAGPGRGVEPIAEGKEGARAARDTVNLAGAKRAPPVPLPA
jgi:hypothetical protein